MIKRQKSARLVVTFATTAAALRMESCAKREHIAGRLIPVPREISAGCGLAWSAPIADGDAVRALLACCGIAAEALTELML